MDGAAERARYHRRLHGQRGQEAGQFKLRFEAPARKIGKIGAAHKGKMGPKIGPKIGPKNLRRLDMPETVIGTSPSFVWILL